MSILQTKSESQPLRMYADAAEDMYTHVHSQGLLDLHWSRNLIRKWPADIHPFVLYAYGMHVAYIQ